jgi:hypothetical protein
MRKASLAVMCYRSYRIDYDMKDPLCDIVIEAAEEWARITGWHIAAPSVLG